MPVFHGAVAAAVLCGAALLGTFALPALEDPKPAAKPLGLFTSLPIYWAEAGDLAGMLKADAQPHWARTALEQNWRLQPLDVLDGEDGLARQRRLLMIQPRPLSPAENVALDDWLRSGGHLLLFADPALTAESAFAFGDRRRPQDVVLLSPILTRWGLELRFDDRQSPGERTVTLADGTDLPVRLAGSFTVRAQEPGQRCKIEADAIVVRCRVGRGSLVAVADAALFEAEAAQAGENRRRRALAKLVAGALGD